YTIWHAIMLISSLSVSAMTMSAPFAPARSRTSGYAALPTTVRTSSRSCSSRSTSGLRSTIVTSFASSRARLNATVVPTWPAPRIRMFIRCPPADSHQLEIRIGDDEPLRAVALEVHLHARVRAAALGVQHDALAEFAVPHPLPEPDTARCIAVHSKAGRALIYRPRDAHRRADLLEQLGRNLPQEARRRRIALHAVQPPL